MSSTPDSKNIQTIYDLVQQIIDTSPHELTQIRIDNAIRVYYGVVEDIIKNSPQELTQLRIDHLDMKDDYFVLA